MFHYRLVNVHQGKALHQVATQCIATNLDIFEQANFVAEDDDNDDDNDEPMWV